MAQARRSAGARRGSTGAVLALLVAIGIGLHNFGEGLAIGAAFALGEAALGTLLIVGFTLHNTTEGLAIVAPIAKERPSLRQLARLGLIGGVPTIAGAWVGGLVYSPVLAVLFLGLGAGAIAQVIAADRPADGRHRVHQQALRFAAGPFGPGGRIPHHARDGHAGRVNREHSCRPSIATSGVSLVVLLLVCAGMLLPRLVDTREAIREIRIVARDMTFYVEDTPTRIRRWR